MHVSHVMHISSVRPFIHGNEKGAACQVQYIRDKFCQQVFASLQERIQDAKSLAAAACKPMPLPEKVRVSLPNFCTAKNFPGEVATCSLHAHAEKSGTSMGSILDNRLWCVLLLAGPIGTGHAEAEH